MIFFIKIRFFVVSMKRQEGASSLTDDRLGRLVHVVIVIVMLILMAKQCMFGEH